MRLTGWTRRALFFFAGLGIGETLIYVIRALH